MDEKSNAQEQHFSPAEALASANDVDARARRHARWPAWLWLTLGVSMPIYLITSSLVSGGWPKVLVTALLVLVAVLGMVYSARQRGTSRLASRLEWPVTLAFIALTFLSIVLRHTILPPGSLLLLVVFGLLPAIPCFYGAWRVLSA